MKLDELEVGKIYQCRLTSKKVLVIEREGKTSDAPDAETIVVKVGKWANIDEERIATYLWQDLYDGQLEEIND